MRKCATHEQPDMSDTQDTDLRDGGQAFPGIKYKVDNVLVGREGMTLREWFAGRALTGYAGRAAMGWEDTLKVARSGAFWKIADAMIEARKEIKT